MNQQLIDRVDSIAPTVIAGREIAEQQGYLAPEVVDAMKEIGLTSLFAPKSLGGLEADPVTVSRITEAVARLDTTAAWFLMVSNTGRFAGSRFSEDLLRTLWGEDINTIVAASGNQPFHGTRTDGGYRLSGTNGFVSGCHHARFMLSPFLTQDAVRVAIFPMTDAQIIDNWHVLGMRGTGSNDVRLDELFVPDEMTWSEADGTGNPWHTGDLYRCPSRVVFSTYVPIALVLAETALDEISALAQDKTPYASAAKLRERSIAQIKFGRALGTFRAARSHYYESMETAWVRAQNGRLATDTEKVDLYLAGTHAVQACADAVRLVQDIAATTAIYDHSPLQRIFRDMEVIRHHGFANESRYGSVAQALWGAPLDYPPMLR